MKIKIEKIEKQKCPLKITLPNPDGTTSIFDVSDMTKRDWKLANVFIKRNKVEWNNHINYLIKTKGFEIKEQNIILDRKKLEFKKLKDYFKKYPIKKWLRK